jgi:hypothetical protein
MDPESHEMSMRDLHCTVPVGGLPGRHCHAGRDDQRGGGEHAEASQHRLFKVGNQKKLPLGSGTVLLPPKRRSLVGERT